VGKGPRKDGRQAVTLRKIHTCLLEKLTRCAVVASGYSELVCT
jgi:hypothetical protein